MKKTLLTPSMGYYRANLHCHSTVSDGKKTPEELKEFYRSHGYSAVAFTDHQAFITHNDLTDDKFVALTRAAPERPATSASSRLTRRMTSTSVITGRNISGAIPRAIATRCTSTRTRRTSRESTVMRV